MSQIRLWLLTSLKFRPNSSLQNKNVHFLQYIIRKSSSCRRTVSTKPTKSHRLPFEVDTNVSKDVTLYRYENIRFHRMLNIFGVAQFFFWTYLSHFAYTCLRDTSKSTQSSESNSFWQKINFGQNKYKNAITLMCFSLGYIILAGTWMFSMRSIRGLVLLRGGEKIKFITYAPFIKQRVLELPVSSITCHHSRHSTNAFLPIKVKGYWMHFLLDKQGTFTNTQLFDFTAGIKRVWK